jgi:flavin reductase (DIM6/NTAB) family NADH-FMN oxidoreductase RutF
MHGTGGTGGSRVTGPERTGIMGFRETRPELLTDNPFKLIGADWMLITAGTKESLKIPVATGSGSSILKEDGYSNRSLTPQKAAENSLAPGFNTMTASWGGLGVLWERKVATCYIRPTRHTFGFVEQALQFTLSFFDEKHRKALTYCGTHSGRDTDKVKGAGLTPVKEGGFVYFLEARLVLACRKIYYQDIGPERFLDPRIEGMYPQKDYHRMYIGEIVKCLVQEI